MAGPPAAGCAFVGEAAACANACATAARSTDAPSSIRWASARSHSDAEACSTCLMHWRPWQSLVTGQRPARLRRWMQLPRRWQMPVLWHWLLPLGQWRCACADMQGSSRHGHARWLRSQQASPAHPRRSSVEATSVESGQEVRHAAVGCDHGPAGGRQAAEGGDEAQMARKRARGAATHASPSHCARPVSWHASHAWCAEWPRRCCPVFNSKLSAQPVTQQAMSSLT